MFLNLRKYEKNIYIVEGLKPLDIRKIIPMSSIIVENLTGEYNIRIVKTMKPVKGCTKVWLGFTDDNKLSRPILIPEIFLNGKEFKITGKTKKEKIFNRLDEVISIDSLCTNFIATSQHFFQNPVNIIKYIRIILLEKLALINDVKLVHRCSNTVTIKDAINEFVYCKSYNFPILHHYIS